MRRHVIGAFLLTSVLLALAEKQGYGVDRVVVHKGERKLVLLSRGKELRSYRIALGGEPNGPKLRQGDPRTPEGLRFGNWLEWVLRLKSTHELGLLLETRRQRSQPVLAFILFGVWRRPSRRTAVAKPNHKSALIESSIGISATAIVASDNRLLQKSFSIRIALRILPGNSATSAVPHIDELAAGGAYRHIHKHTSKLAIAGPVNCTPNHDLLGAQLDAN
jgi:hypothetical protein